jgi:hypothetical protein
LLITDNCIYLNYGEIRSSYAKTQKSWTSKTAATTATIAADATADATATAANAAIASASKTAVGPFCP